MGLGRAIVLEDVERAEVERRLLDLKNNCRANKRMAPSTVTKVIGMVEKVSGGIETGALAAVWGVSNGHTEALDFQLEAALCKTD